MFLLCLGPSVHLPVSCLFLRSSVLNPWDEHWSLMLMASSTRVAWIKGDQGQPQDARMGTASASVCRRAVRLILSSRDIPRIQHSSWKLGDSLVNVGWEVTSKEFLVLSAPDYCYWALPVCVRAVVRGVDLCGCKCLISVLWDSQTEPDTDPYCNEFLPTSAQHQHASIFLQAMRNYVTNGQRLRTLNIEIYLVRLAIIQLQFIPI